MVEMTTGFEMVPHWTFCIIPRMFYGSFSHRSFSFADVVFATAWTADFVNYIRFTQQWDFVFGRCEVSEVCCLEEGFDLYLLLRIQESDYLLSKRFDATFSR